VHAATQHQLLPVCSSPTAVAAVVAAAAVFPKQHWWTGCNIIIIIKQQRRQAGDTPPWGGATCLRVSPPRATATQARSKPNYVFPPDTAMALHPTQGFPALRALAGVQTCCTLAAPGCCTAQHLLCAEHPPTHPPQGVCVQAAAQRAIHAGGRTRGAAKKLCPVQ
jgi:hypothetical protein